ncbi:hypothetical protein [Beijerinckia mobilis]|uniref:hypothetical protein n=1 Tax=Beijerinckia mobilis TaxID=231434 RepID=UPI00147019AB|nr:hypothetical protein [Beijerinckia mobilis]
MMVFGSPWDSAKHIFRSVLTPMGRGSIDFALKSKINRGFYHARLLRAVCGFSEPARYKKKNAVFKGFESHGDFTRNQDAPLTPHFDQGRTNW